MPAHHTVYRRNQHPAKSSRRGVVWSGAISFGLINIPVTVHTAEQEHELHFNMIDQRNMAHVKFKRVNEKTGKEVPYSEIVKGYPYQSGKYIIMTDEDFKRANPKATQTLDIQSFVKLGDIDLLYFSRPYYLLPQKGGEKGYRLLLEALNRTERVAVATVVMHTKAHLTCIFPRGDFLILEVLRFSHDLKELPGEKPARTTFKPQELKMAEQLIQGMTAKWEPEQYQDTYYDDLKRHIEYRIAAGKGKTVERSPEEESEISLPTHSKDLMQLLKASLEKSPHRKERRSLH